MYLKRKLFGRRIAFYARKVELVNGINSELGPGRHAILLDCDNCSERQLRSALAVWLDEWDMPRADYLTTGRPDSWHVYVFCSVDFAYALKAACCFPHCDPAHLLWSHRRGHFTLRFSSKRGRSIEWSGYVDGPQPASCSLDDFTSYTKYETASRV